MSDIDLNSKIIDLDLLRPKKHLVKLAGHEIDVSFIPLGITFEIDSLSRQLLAISPDKRGAGGEETKKAFDLTIKMCSTFASLKHPEMDENWFRENADARQLGVFASAIRTALEESYKGVEAHGKKRKNS